MNSESPAQLTTAPSSQPPRPPDDQEHGDSASSSAPESKSQPQTATVIVRGESVRAQPTATSESHQRSQQPEGKKVVAAKVQKQSRLPALDDDADVGQEKKQRVVRDDKADLAFTGTLLASAAPASAPAGHWNEYRVYQTNSGKHVFSKIARSVLADEPDHFEAEVFEPSPSSVSTQLLRSAREIARSKPVEWSDAAISFFGYDPLAKALYRKLGDQFDEEIN